MKAYKVYCETTGALMDSTYGPLTPEGQNTYRKCKDGVLWVVTDNPKRIFDEFPATCKIEEVGVGYSI
jgi:hypothetical protein